MGEIQALEKIDSSLPFMLFEQLDDELIRQELEGKIPEVLTYHFFQKDKEVWGLSKAGTDESVRLLARKGEVIREMELNYRETPDEYLFVGKAARFSVTQDGKEIMLDSKYGVKRQAKNYNNGMENPFAFEQGGMKAMRNASQRLIPKEIVLGVIEYAKREGKVKEVKYEPRGKNEAVKGKPNFKELREKLGNFIFNMEDKDRDKASHALGEITNKKYRSMTHIPDEDLETIFIKAEKYYGMSEEEKERTGDVETDSRPHEEEEGTW